MLNLPKVFYPNHHGIIASEMLNIGAAEARCLHPLTAVRTGKVKTARGFDEHVQAHQKPKQVLPPIVVDECLDDDERTADGQRLVGFFY